MIRKIVASVAFTAALSMPALAATEYWVAKDTATNKCEVVQAKPDGTKMMDAGKKHYSSMASANRAMKEMKACK